MRIDIVNFLHVMLLAVIFVSVFSYTVISVRNTIKNLNSKIIKGGYLLALDYSRYLLIQNYSSYEKYDVWRYCVKF